MRPMQQLIVSNDSEGTSPCSRPWPAGKKNARFIVRWSCCAGALQEMLPATGERKSGAASGLRRPCKFCAAAAAAARTGMMSQVLLAHWTCVQ